MHDTLAELGGEALLASLAQLEAGALSAEPQDDALANYAKKLFKDEAKIDWSRSASELLRRVNAFNPWPVAQTLYGDKVLRIWGAELVDGPSAAAGTVVACSKQGVDVACGSGTLRLTRLQLPGKKPLDAVNFVNAHDLSGVTLGGA